MNLLLLRPEDVTVPGQARVTGRRAEHVQRVLGKSVGDTLRIGVLDGEVGVATVRSVGGGAVELVFSLGQAPPLPLRLVLVVALPRPPMLRRILQTAATFGVKELHLFQARRVEKSFWNSGAVAESDVREQLCRGLEQGRDTRMPVVHRHERFRPLVEAELPDLAAPGSVLLADLAADVACPTAVTDRTVVVVGPEGGFIPFEEDLLATAGVRTVSLGPRPLRVDVAVAALLGRMS